MAKRGRKSKSKVLNTITNLKLKGHNVKYIKRKDGGYKITQIDGVKYSGAKGNEAGRKLTGETLSEAQMTQRRGNVEKYIKKDPISQDIKKQIARIQARERKNIINGKTTTKKVRWRIAHKGIEDTKTFLERRERYTKGYADERNVTALIQRIERTAMGFEGDKKEKLLNLAQEIETNKSKFLEKWIEPIYSYLYDITRDFDNAYNGIKRILTNQFIYIYGQLESKNKKKKTKKKK